MATNEDLKRHLQKIVEREFPGEQVVLSSSDDALDALPESAADITMPEAKSVPTIRSARVDAMNGPIPTSSSSKPESIGRSYLVKTVEKNAGPLDAARMPRVKVIRGSKVIGEQG